jgi:rhodanese-related sulfurtransferase
MGPTRINTDEVKRRMDQGEVFTFIDARNPTAWGQSSEKLPTALRVPADDVDSHLTEIPKDRTAISYCT